MTFASTESEVLKRRQSEAFKAGKEWFKDIIRSHCGDIRESDLSTRTESARAKELARARFLTEERPYNEHFKLSFSESEFEYYSKINVHHWGFRLSAEYIDGKVAVRAKPKARYKVIRQQLEMALHLWGVQNTTEDMALIPLGQISIYSIFQSFVLTTVLGIYYHNQSKVLVDAAFIPEYITSPPAMPMHPIYIPCPTLVVQVAYRHQSLKDLFKEASERLFSCNTSIQILLAIKIFDDQKFMVGVYRRGEGDAPHVKTVTSMVSLTVPTTETITLSAKALLWGVPDLGPMRDCVLELEPLRYILSTRGETKVLD